MSYNCNHLPAHAWLDEMASTVKKYKTKNQKLDEMASQKSETKANSSLAHPSKKDLWRFYSYYYYYSIWKLKWKNGKLIKISLNINFIRYFYPLIYLTFNILKKLKYTEDYINNHKLK